MKNKIIAAAAAGMLLMNTAALAEGITFSGTVGASETYEVYAPIGGTVADVYAQVGQKIAAGDAIAQLRTEKVYAAEAGTVTGIFGEPGESAETVAAKYGAVLYIEGEQLYTVSATTDRAYDATENKFVHVGEQVYLECTTDGDHIGSGVISSVEGTSYTVDVTDGVFEIGETVAVYRGSSAQTEQRLGRGTLSRRNPTAVSGTGSIVSFAVQDGDTVEKGDLLFETLTGSFDGLYMSGSAIAADADGVVAQISLASGGRAEKGSVAAVLYPENAVRIEAQISEADLGYISVGDRVEIELGWDQDGETIYEGTISFISAIANTSAAGADAMGAVSTGEVTFDVHIDFTPDENVRYGMSALVTTVEAQDDEA